MDRKVPISDATISRNATQHLASTGLRSPCHIQVQTRNGEITLSGIVQYDHQRNAAVQAVRNIEGVKRVIENLKVMPAPKGEYKPPPPRQATAAPPAAEPQAATSSDADAGASTPTADTVSVAASPPPALQEAHPDPTAASTTEVLAGGSPSIDLSFRVDVLPQGAALAPPLVVQSAPAAQAVPAHPAQSSAAVSRQAAAPNVSGEIAPTAPASGSTAKLRYRRVGEEFTFECATSGDTEVVRCLLENYADWLKQNTSVGEPKDSDQPHRLTFYAKSVIDFLREQGF